MAFRKFNSVERIEVVKPVDNARLNLKTASSVGHPTLDDVEVEGEPEEEPEASE